MTWEQKLAAIQNLTDAMSTSLHMRNPGDWYVHQSGVEIGGDGMLASASGNGATPEEAVNEHTGKNSQAYLKIAT